jgi:hypothetical protein
MAEQKVYANKHDEDAERAIEMLNDAQGKDQILKAYDWAAHWVLWDEVSDDVFKKWDKLVDTCNEILFR